MPWWPRRTTRVRTSRTGPSRRCSRIGSSRSVAVPRTASWSKSTRKPAGASRSSSGPSDPTASESPTTPPTPAGRCDRRRPIFIFHPRWKSSRKLMSRPAMGARVDFPYFEHLHYYDQVRDARLNISYSNVREFTFGEFRRELPKDLDLNWANTNGPERLRKMIAGRHGTGVDRVLMTTGATEGNFVVNASMVRPGDRVLVDSPIYSPLRDVPTGLGAQVIRISRACDDGWRLDLNRWRAEAKAGARPVVSANLGNPTSEALSRTEIGEVTEIAEESEAYVLVDETCRELAFERRPPSLAQFGPRMIALCTITKVCGLGTLRAGWIVAEPNLLERFGRIKDYTSGGNSALGQLVASWALERWGFFLRRARRILTRNRKVVREALAKMPALQAEVPPFGTVLFPKGGTSAWSARSEEHTSELQSRQYLVCRLLLEKNSLRSHPPRP